MNEQLLRINQANQLEFLGNANSHLILEDIEKAEFYLRKLKEKITNGNDDVKRLIQEIKSDMIHASKVGRADENE